MLESIITSKTRIKLLLRLFLKENSKSYLREMEKDLGESVNAVRVELNRFESAGLVNGESVNGKKYFRANTRHPLYSEIHAMLIKFVGIDKITECIASKVKGLEAAYLSGNLAMGLDSDIIQVLLVGRDMDENVIEGLVKKTQKLIERRLDYLIMSGSQFKNFFANKPLLLIWEPEK